MKTRIIIFGCGVGGLTVAHELSKNPKFDITMYEKKSVIGGLARSSRDQDGCATEYCWRVYFHFYDNLFKIMSEIPLIEDNRKSVIDNITNCSNKNVADINFSLHDKFIGLYNIVYGLTSSDARLNQLDNISWWKSLEGTKSSHLLRAIGPWLGADRYSCSYKSVIKVGMELDIIPGIFDRSGRIRNKISTKPTSEAWFNHWKLHLQNSGVKINFGISLDSVNISNNRITSVVVDDGYHKNSVTADYYVFALPVEILDIIVNKTPGLQYGQMLDIQRLKNISLHIQLSFQLYFDRSVSLGMNSDPHKGGISSFLLIDTPWDIIVLQYDKIYKNTYLCEGIPNVKGGWSVAACTAYIPGIVYGKPLNRCTYEEIITELWQQMYTSKELQKIIRENNGFYMESYMVVKWSPMWPTYHFNRKIQKLITSEPKFTNNAGTYALRPSYRTHIDNLFISTAYIKETIDIFSTEAAAIAGKFVANAIGGSPEPVIRPRPSFFKPLRSFDTFAFKNKLPNLFLFIVLICIIIVIIIVWKILAR